MPSNHANELIELAQQITNNRSHRNDTTTLTITADEIPELIKTPEVREALDKVLTQGCAKGIRLEITSPLRQVNTIERPAKGANRHDG